MMQIVIDKSYLQAAPTKSVRRLCEENTVLFLETLLYELLSTRRNVRAACFTKLPDATNPVVLIPRVGPLFRYEMEHLQPASPLVSHQLELNFRFAPELSGEAVSSHQQEILSNWEQEVRREVQTFHEVATGVSAWCPELTRASRAVLPEACMKLKQGAVSNPEVVCGVYRSLGLTGFPPASLINPSWVLFRWVQSHLLFALDYLSRYGFTEHEQIPQRVEHDIHDIQYALFGALAGAIATEDAGIRSNFELMCPGGAVVSYSHEPYNN